MTNQRKTGRSKASKNLIQNVRVVDKDEGTDDVVLQRLVQAYASSEGQIRVICGVRTELGVGATPAGGTIGFLNLASSDDFVSFSAQYVEFRVRGIRYDIYDVAPNSTPAVNYWATFHTVDTTVAVDAEDVMDRPDCRSVTPGDGKATLAWLAHGIPEMEFQATTSYQRLGGLSYNLVSSANIPTKYVVTAKFVVDFRGRR